MSGWTKRYHHCSCGASVPLALQGYSEPKPNPVPLVWTGPTLARHLQKNAAQKLGTSSFLLFADKCHLCGLPATATGGGPGQPAAAIPACVPGTEAGGSLHVRPPHHGVFADLSSQLNPRTVSFEGRNLKQTL
ncbi:Motile sperm domain-containing protein 3 [Cricetulus griseus]|uniref:Motile sperm domain-containing protein 3 n=1 Tax=Cricetulus griseus TaxID=10029 RepID=G3I7H4_CRIGR|nr:Motile sperm domain-containing protein 3 [Cricetulus griseus]